MPEISRELILKKMTQISSTFTFAVSFNLYENIIFQCTSQNDEFSVYKLIYKKMSKVSPI